MAFEIALYDACVLYPFYLRDLLVRLALTNLFQAKWTDEIHDSGAPVSNAAALGAHERIVKFSPDAYDEYQIAGAKYAGISCGLLRD